MVGAGMGGVAWATDDSSASCDLVRCPGGTTCVEANGTVWCRPDGPACGKNNMVCPGAGTCIDDPTDNCDPDRSKKGCPGVCECNATGLCIEGYHWDSSPSVCGCVPDGEPCGPVTCAAGLVCCNESCGICTEPGGGCIKIFCE